MAEPKRDHPPTDYPESEIARRRDETIKRMIATPPTPQSDIPKKRAELKKKRKKAKA